MKTKSNRQRLVLSLLLMAFAASVHAGEGAVGNGGGTWVCREQNGDVRWVKLVDLFEAQGEFGLTLAQLQGKYEDIVDQTYLRLYRANPKFAEAVLKRLDELNYLRPSNDVIWTDDTLSVIDDSLYRLKPSVRKCTGGLLGSDPKSGEPMIPYGQVVNFKNDGKLLVQSELFNNLTETEKAALVYHEAIYALRRDVAGDKNSVSTRRIIGLLFSTLSTEELKRELQAIVPDSVVPDSGAKPMEFVKLDGKCHSSQRLTRIEEEFEIQTAPVTQAQYVSIMGSLPDIEYQAHTKGECPGTFMYIQGVAVCPNRPVVPGYLSNIDSFISRLNEQLNDGYSYRLPNEVEWEYAARGGSQDIWWFGNDPSLLVEYAWIESNSGKSIHDVKLLKPNPFGLYDMAGNVTQLTSKRQIDSSGVEWEQVRGGSFVDSWDTIWNTRPSSHRWVEKNKKTPLGVPMYYYDLGFRLVRTRKH